MFPTLYSHGKNGQVKQWQITVFELGNHSKTIIRYGMYNGKQVESVSIKSSLDHYKQTLKEAKSRWDKKINAGYNTEITRNEKTFLPMLACDYAKYQNKLTLPCIIQPKLDGYRMIYRNGKITSRTGKEIFEIIKRTELYNELLKIDKDLILDGELYIHGCDFEKLGVIRNKKEKLTKEEEEILHSITYNVYDIIDYSLEYVDRIKSLPSGRYIKTVDGVVVDNLKDLNDMHAKFVGEGYEGSILRNLHGKYTSHRSFDLFKYKNFDDAEYRIVGFTNEKESIDKKVIVWICEHQDKTFTVQSSGTVKERQTLYENGNEFVNRYLWVKHWGFTKNGIPRFPKTMRNGKESIRDRII